MSLPNELNCCSGSERPAVSIIIPVYKVEEWIERAVRALQEQTFSDFELFLVDDGSPDASGTICDNLAAADSRIRVIHRENGGAASARNEAIVKATGKYLYFMDGDDWCEPSMLEDMYTLAEANDLDLVVTGFYIDTYYSDSQYYRELRNAPDVVYATQKEFRENSHKLFDAQLLYAPWNKLYRREYLSEKGIFFPATFWDDLPFNLSVLRDVERVGCLDGHYYHFLRARAESENTKYRSDMYDKREEEHLWLKELYEYWDIESEAVREFLSRRYAERLIGCIENVTNNNCHLSKSEKLVEIDRIISTPQVKEALQHAKPSSAMMGVLFLPIKAGNARLTMLEGSFISFVKRNSTNLFARLKANR